MIKKSNIVGILMILFMVCAIASIIAPASAAQVHIPLKKVDHKSKIYEYKSAKYKVNWNTYKYDIDESDDIRQIDLSYKIIHKKSKNIITGTGSINLEKISKNRLKISEYYSKYEKEKITYKKTSLSAKSYYWNVYRPYLIKNIKYPMTITTYLIDNGSTPYEQTKEHYKNANTAQNNKLIWKTLYYSKYGNLRITQYYIVKDYNIGGNPIIDNITVTTMPMATKNSDYIWDSGEIRINKVSKNLLKISLNYISKVDGTGSGHKIEYVKTNLSPKEYYKRIYKQHMIKEYYNVNCYDRFYDIDLIIRSIPTENSKTFN